MYFKRSEGIRHPFRVLYESTYCKKTFNEKSVRVQKPLHKIVHAVYKIAMKDAIFCSNTRFQYIDGCLNMLRRSLIFWAQFRRAKVIRYFRNNFRADFPFTFLFIRLARSHFCSAMGHFTHRNSCIKTSIRFVYCKNKHVIQHQTQTMYQY